MKATQEAGSAAKNRRAKEPKDFKACFLGSLHVSTEGWYGLPAASFRNAMISACRVAGYTMTKAKLSVFTVADGWDRGDGSPMVRFTKGEPQYCEHHVRLQTGVPDIRARGMWMPGWEAEIKVQYDADQFTATDVANLLARAGAQVGIGEGRPDSRDSAGMGWGTFKIKEG